jgi:hypothetical protein
MAAVRTQLAALMLVVAAVQAVFAVLLLVRPQPVLDLWPLAGTTELTFIFFASMFAAAAASTAWAAIFGDPASYVGIALDYLAIFIPMALFLAFVPGPDGHGAGWFLFALAALIGFGGWLLWVTIGEQPTDPRPTPRPVLVVFAVFSAALIVVAVLLVAGVPNVLPWQLTNQLSVIAGLNFAGAAIYFLYGLVRRGWFNAGGQLAGFLGYDLVLILPFLARLPTVADQWRVSLITYVVVLVLSGIVATWYLFIASETRIRLGRGPVVTDRAAA